MPSLYLQGMALRPQLLYIGLGALVAAACGGSGGIAANSGGGGGGGGGGSASTANVRVVLPAGVATTSATLVTGVADVAVGSAAQSVQVNSGGPTLATVIDTSTGKLLTLGVISPDGTTQTLDAENAATALLMIATGVANEHGARRTDLVAQIKASAATNVLATILTAAWNTNKFALEEPSAELKTAIETAAASVSAVVKRPSRPGDDVQTDEFTTKLNLTVRNVDGDQSQFRMFVANNNPAPNGAYGLTSFTTKPAIAFQYKTNVNGEVLPTPEPIGEAIDVPYLTQYTVGGSIRARDFTHDVPQDVESIKYWTVLLSPTFDVPDHPDMATPYWAGEVGRWRGALADLRQLALLRVFGEMILDLTGAGGQPFTLEQLKQSIPGLTAASADMATAVSYGKLETGALSTLDLLLSGTANGDSTAAKVLDALRPIAGFNAQYLTLQNLSPNRVRALRAALRVYATLGLSKPLGQYGVTVRELVTGARMTNFEATYSRGRLTLTPNAGQFIRGGTIGIAALLRDITPADEPSFVWRVKGSNGPVTLRSSDGQSGTEITTTLDRVNVLTTGNTQEYIDIECELWAKNAQGQREKIATDTANFVETGTLTHQKLFYAVRANHHTYYWVAILPKEQIGKNRWKGGQFRARIFKNGDPRYLFYFTVPEYVGLPNNLATDPRSTITWLQPDNISHPVHAAYDLGDRLMFVAAYFYVDPTVHTQEQIDWAHQQAQTEAMETTIVAWRQGD